MAMTESRLEVRASTPVPEFLIGDVRNRLAYLDEQVKAATISPDGSTVVVVVDAEIGPARRAELSARIQTIVSALADEPYEPPVRVIEEQSHAHSFRDDPM